MNPEGDCSVLPPGKSSELNYDLVATKFIKAKTLYNFMHHPPLLLWNSDISPRFCIQWTKLWICWFLNKVVSDLWYLLDFYRNCASKHVTLSSVFSVPPLFFMRCLEKGTSNFSHLLFRSHFWNLHRSVFKELKYKCNWSKKGHIRTLGYKT